MKPKLIFDHHSLDLVLEAFDVTVDMDGFLVKDGERIKDYVHNESILKDDLLGIHKVGFFRGDIDSVMKLNEL